VASARGFAQKPPNNKTADVDLSTNDNSAARLSQVDPWFSTPTLTDGLAFSKLVTLVKTAPLADEVVIYEQMSNKN